MSNSAVFVCSSAWMCTCGHVDLLCMFVFTVWMCRCIEFVLSYFRDAYIYLLWFYYAGELVYCVGV